MKVVLKKSDVCNWMRRELAVSVEEYTDCGDVNRTRLGEDAVAALGWDRERVPDFVWDAAHDVAEQWEGA